MPENLGDATLRLRANSDRLKSDLDKARRNVDESARAMSKKLATVGLGFTAAGAAVLAPLAFAIKEASNLEESVNAVNVVFGEGGGTILDFGKIAATQVGIAQSEFNQLATQTGALLTNFGQTEQEAADTTLLLTNRAADLASVHNTDVKDALYAINSALRGETEAIRRYAADVTDASLEAYLFAKGIDGGVKSLTQSEKALLRVEALMYQTDKVQGDFQNTSASFANQTRILGATWKDLAATGGDVLLPVVSDMVYMVGQVAARVRVFTQENPKLFATLVKVSAVIGLLLIGIGALLLTMSLGIRVFLAAKGAALGPSHGYQSSVGVDTAVQLATPMVAASDTCSHHPGEDSRRGEADLCRCHRHCVSRRHGLRRSPHVCVGSCRPHYLGNCRPDRHRDSPLEELGQS